MPKDTTSLQCPQVLRWEKHDISLEILHQAGFETARQAATSAERHALAIAPCSSQLHSSLSHDIGYFEDDKYPAHWLE